MYAIRQLFRQPLKILSAIMMIALAVAVLCVCVGQAAAAVTTAAKLEYSFTTVALPTAKYQRIEGTVGNAFYLPYLSDEILEWIDQTIERNQELVEAIASPGLASAYIPELIPDNYTNYLDQTMAMYGVANFTAMPEGMPYSCAMMEVTLEEVGEPLEVKSYYESNGGLADEYVILSLQFPLTATIEHIIGLQESFRDPTGTKIHLTLELPEWESLEELGLIVGERYLVYGMDYQDLDWQFRSEIACESDYEIEISAFDLKKLQYTDEETIRRAEENGVESYTVATYHDGEHWVQISNYDMEKFQSSSLTLKDCSVTPVPWKTIVESDGSIRFEKGNTRSYIDEKGQLVTVSLDEYQERYSVPTIAHLKGSAEEFLASEQGAAWRGVLDQLEINNHAFPIIGVEKLGYIAEFARGNSRIVEGRDFTKEELDTGTTVCVISETLAAANGLAVGDTISLRYYRGDGSLPYQHNIESGYGTTNPTAYFYFATTPFEGDAVEYTIVGLYRQDNAWCDVSENLYSFTPNTIFTPKASVTGTMTYSDQGFFRTIVLKNGALERFMEIVDSAGYEGLFVYYDQGYSVVAANLHNYQTASQRAMVVGIAVYVIVFLLFMLMFPLRCGHTIMIMESLGTDRGNIVWYVLKSSLGIVIPGTMVGVTVGMVLWKRVVDAIMTSAGAVLDLVMDPMVLCTIVVVQLCLVICMVLVAAMVMTRPKCLMSGE